MKHTLRRRTATAVVTFAAAAGSLLAAGGAASAATNPAADRTAVVSHSSHSGTHGDDHFGWGYHHGHRGDHRDHRGDHRGEHRHHRGDHRWDGRRNWEREGRYWYTEDHGVRYRCDGSHFYRLDRGAWIVVFGDMHRFDISFFR